MLKQPRPRGDEAARLVDGLFEHPPVSEAELAQRLAGGDPGRLRFRLRRRLETGSLSEAEVPLLCHAFSCLGVGEEGEPIAEILRQGDDLHRRAAALQILARIDPVGLEALIEGLGPAQVPVVEHWLSDLLGEAQANQGVEVARALEATAPARRGVVFELLEVCRARVGTSASAAYGAALTRPGLTMLHAPIRAALEAEAASETVAPPGLGYLGSCDGQGTFVVLGATENREDGTYNLSQICVRAGGELCDGFLTPRCSREELRERLAEITQCTGIEFVPCELAEVASISRAASTRGDEGGEVSKGARAALALLERARPWQETEGASSGERIEASHEPLRALLSRPPYQHSWYFDRGDLEGNGVSLPGEGGFDDWLAEAARSLDRPSIRERLAAMARHMARWHRRGGELRAAALCESAALQVEQACGESALLRVMLERSIVPAEEESRDVEVGHDPVLLRQRLKQVFFSQISEPSGRDLAQLDFTEAAFGCLEEACLSIPSERRPREDHQAAASFAIGKAFADFLLAGARAPIEQVIDQIERALHEICHLDRAECRRAIERVLPLLGDFIDSHCARCPVACLDRPEATLAEAFFAAGHPVATGQKGR